jgi:hypothetical protein
MVSPAARRTKWTGNRGSLLGWRLAPVVLGLWALGLWALPASAAELSPEDASKHIGETATVCGEVASARFLSGSRSQPTLLNLGKAYPHQVFTATILGGDRAKFGTPEKALLGKRICVTGEIKDFHTKPEIILSDPKQLTQ